MSSMLNDSPPRSSPFGPIGFSTEESGSEVVLSLLSVVFTPLIMLLMLSVTNPVMKNAQRPKTTSAMMKVAQKLRSEFIPSLTFYGFDRRSAKSCQSHNIIPYCSAFFNI